MRRRTAALVLTALALPALIGAASAFAAAPGIEGVTAVGRLTTTTARLDARVDPQGSAVTTCSFEYGPTASYGQSAPCLSDVEAETPFAGAGGTIFTPVGAVLSGLAPGATYHYRLVATNADGPTEGEDHTFTTPATTPAPGTGASGDRVNEWVSTADKNQQLINFARLSLDGNRVLYGTFGPGGGGSSPTFGQFVANREPGGWTAKSALPPLDQQVGTVYQPGYSTPDLSGSTMPAYSGFTLPPASPVAWVRLSEGGAQTILHAFPPDPTGEVFAGPVAMSDDLSHVFLDLPQSLDPADTNGQPDIYDIGSGTPVLVSLLPGASAASSCGVSTGLELGFPFGSNNGGHRLQHWVSTDGTKVFFESHGDAVSCAPEASPRQLYMRDLATNTTTLISGPVVSGPDRGVGFPEGGGFLQAAADGSWVIYRTSSKLDPADANADADIYKWTEAQGNACLTCVVPDANVDFSPGNGRVNAVASRDGSHVYFISTSQLLLDEGTPGARNIYAWHRTSSSGPQGEVGYVGDDRGSLTPNPTFGTELSPDGNVLIFVSGAQVNADVVTGPSCSGLCSEYYRYDDRDGSVICVSCARGAQSHDVHDGLSAGNGFYAQSTVLSDDGSSFEFQTEEALVPQDVNNAPDVYEWRDGRVGLITDGTTSGQNVNPSGLSGSGRDMLFVASGGQAPGVPDTSPQVYDARIGGAQVPSSSPSPACSGEGCQGNPSAAPREFSPASASFAGPGNAKPRKHHRRKKTHHKPAAGHNRGGGK